MAGWSATLSPITRRGRLAGRRRWSQEGVDDRVGAGNPKRSVGRIGARTGPLRRLRADLAREKPANGTRLANVLTPTHYTLPGGRRPRLGRPGAARERRSTSYRRLGRGVAVAGCEHRINQQPFGRARSDVTPTYSRCGAARHLYFALTRSEHRHLCYVKATRPDDPRVPDLRVTTRPLGAYDALARSGDKKPAGRP